MRVEQQLRPSWWPLVNKMSFFKDNWCHVCDKFGLKQFNSSETTSTGRRNQKTVKIKQVSFPEIHEIQDKGEKIINISLNTK